MLSLKENIRAVLECHFSQSKDELIDSATDNIYVLFSNQIKSIKAAIQDIEEGTKGE